MSDKSKREAKAGETTREQRLKAALRANLRRRKAAPADAAGQTSEDKDSDRS